MKFAALPLLMAVAVMLSGCGASQQRSLQSLSGLGYEFEVNDYLRAATEGSLRAVRIFQTAGMPVDASNSFFDTALIRASRSGHEDLVSHFLEFGADVNHSGRYGRTPLIHACERGDGEIVQMLLGRGADPRVVDDKNWTGLTMAAYEGHDDLVKLLIPVSSESLDRALMVAAVGGDAQVVRLLIEAGANMKVRNATGCTPLLLAAQHGHRRVCKILLAFGADPMETNHDGKSAADLANLKGFPELAGALAIEMDKILAATPVPAEEPVERTPKPNYAGVESKPIVSVSPPQRLVPADGLTIRLEKSVEAVSSVPTPLLRDQWPSLEGKVLRLQDSRSDGALDEVFSLREFNYEPALLTFLGIEDGQAVVRLAGETAPRNLRLGDAVPNTSMEVVRILPRVSVDPNNPEIYEDRSQLILEDTRTGVQRTLIFGETRDEGSPYAVIAVGSAKQEYWVRPGHSFTLLRPDSAAQDYRVVSLRPSKLEIENVASQEVISITRQGLAESGKKRRGIWTLGFFR